MTSLSLAWSAGVLRPLLLGLLALASGCATNLEGTFEVTTRAVEESSREETVELNSLGDRFILPENADNGRLAWEGGGLDLNGKDEVVVRSETLDRAPGKRTRVWVNGKEGVSREGYVRLTATWTVTTRKILPPLVWEMGLSLKEGESVDIDETVMYACPEGSTFHELTTRTRFTGDDRERFRFTPAAPLEKGRVSGKITTVKKNG